MKGSIKLPYYKVYKADHSSLQKTKKLFNGEINPYTFLSRTMLLSDGLLSGEKRIYNYRHSRARRISENLLGILANRWRMFFTIINLKLKCVKDVIFAALILRNMLIKSPNLVKVYHPAFFSNNILEDGEITEREWWKNEAPNSFYSLQVPRTGYNSSLYAKSVREKFMDYFVNDGAVEWQWKYCQFTILCKIGKKTELEFIYI